MPQLGAMPKGRFLGGRWRNLFAGLVLALLAAPLLNAGVMLLYERRLTGFGLAAPLQNLSQLICGLLLTGLSLGLFFAQARRDAYQGLDAWLQRLGYLSYLLLVFGGSGAGLTSSPHGPIYLVYAATTMAGLGLGLLWLIARMLRRDAVARASEKLEDSFEKTRHN